MRYHSDHKMVGKPKVKLGNSSEATNLGEFICLVHSHKSFPQGFTGDKPEYQNQSFDPSLKYQFTYTFPYSPFVKIELNFVKSLYHVAQFTFCVREWIVENDLKRDCRF